MMEEKTKVSLSNDGLSSFFTKKKTMNTTFFWNKKNNRIESAFEEMVEHNNEHRITSDKIPAFENYFKELKVVINRNKIQDTDKVFFASNSVFPRSSFNKYSKKARRVEILTNSTIIVINNINYYTHAFNIYESNNYFLNIKKYYFTDIQDIIKYNDKNVLTADPLFVKLKREIETFHPNIDIINSFRVEVINRQLEEETVEITLKKIIFNNTKDAETFDLLVQGMPISIFVDTKEASRYINNFKTKLDKASYSLLLTALSEGNSNITMGLKLLENMDISKGKAYLYALFLIAFSKNESAIKNNSSFRGVGMKSIRDTNNLNIITSDYFGTNNKMRLIESVYKLLEEERDKLLFKELVDALLHKHLKQFVGAQVYDFMNIKNLAINEYN